METTQLTFTFEGTPAPSQIAAKLRFQAGLLEGMSGKEAASRKNTDAAPLSNGHDTSEAAITAKPAKTTKKTAAKAAPVEDENFDLGEETEVEAEAIDEEPTYTQSEVAKACAAFCKKNGTDEEKIKAQRQKLAGLFKKFGAGSSLNNLKAEHYGDFMKAIGA